MIKAKKFYISLILMTIAAFYIWFIVLDFSRFIGQNYTYDIFPSSLLKRISVLLSAVIVWLVGKDGLNSRDSRRMKAAFIFACLGEAIFLTGEYIIGVIMFAFCQAILVVRNSTGQKNKLIQASQKQKNSLILSGLLILAVLIAISSLFKTLVKVDSSIVIIYMYGILLCISLYSGLACNILVLLPKRNSRMAAIGMICFFCCDVLVGLDAALPVGFTWLLANSFIWVFYIPALVFLALSCYKYNVDKRTDVLHNIYKTT